MHRHFLMPPAQTLADMASVSPVETMVPPCSASALPPHCAPPWHDASVRTQILSACAYPYHAMHISRKISLSVLLSLLRIHAAVLPEYSGAVPQYPAAGAAVPPASVPRPRLYNHSFYFPIQAPEAPSPSNIRHHTGQKTVLSVFCHIR